MCQSRGGTVQMMCFIVDDTSNANNLCAASDTHMT